MATHIGMSGIRNLVECCIGINGVRRNIAEIYVGQNGTPRLVWQEKAPPGQQIFTSSGIFVVPARVKKVDVFLVAGGNGAGTGYENASKQQVIGNAGAGGAIKTIKGISVTPGASIAVTIGAGGQGGKDAASASDIIKATLGGTSSFGTYSVSNTNAEPSSGSSGGGVSGFGHWNSTGLILEGYGGQGGQDGSNGYKGESYLKDPILCPSGVYNQGQHTTTRAFGESSGTLFASGGCGLNMKALLSAFLGGGGFDSGKDTLTTRNGAANTGGGGGVNDNMWLNNKRGGNGGSGIVIVRW